jgi:hypothetical protein
MILNSKVVRKNVIRDRIVKANGKFKLILYPFTHIQRKQLMEELNAFTIMELEGKTVLDNGLMAINALNKIKLAWVLKIDYTKSFKILQMMAKNVDMIMEKRSNHHCAMTFVLRIAKVPGKMKVLVQQIVRAQFYRNTKSIENLRMVVKTVLISVE